MPPQKKLVKKYKVTGNDDMERSERTYDPWDIEAVIRSNRFFLNMESIVENYRMYDPLDPLAKRIWKDSEGIQGLPRITDYFPDEFIFIIKACPSPLPREAFAGPSFNPQLSFMRRPGLSESSRPPSSQEDGQAEAKRRRIQRRQVVMATVRAVAASLGLGGLGPVTTATTSGNGDRISEGGSLGGKKPYKPSPGDGAGPSSPADLPPPDERPAVWSNWRSMDQFPQEVQERMMIERAAANDLINHYCLHSVEMPARTIEANEALAFRIPEFQRFEPVPNPTQPLPLLSASTTRTRQNLPNFQCKLLYTEHTESLTIPDVHQTFKVLDIPSHPAVKARIDAFLKAFHLPQFSRSNYTFFFCPSPTRSQLASRWAKTKNAALVIRPKTWTGSSTYKSYSVRRLEISTLMREIDELISKGSCQLGMLRVLNEVMEEFWRDKGMRMFPHEAQWKAFDATPNAFCSILLRLLRRGEEEVARLVARRAIPSVPLDHPITQQLAASTDLLARRRAELARLEQELAFLKTTNAGLHQQINFHGPAPDPAEMEEKRRRYHTIAKPMFQIWGRTMLEYARFQAQGDLVGHYDIVREANPARWQQYNRDVHVIRTQHMNILREHGMDVGMLMFTRMSRGNHQNLVDNAGHNAAHDIDMEAMAAAVTSQYFVDMQPHLRNLFRLLHPGTNPDVAAESFRRRYRDNQAWVDLV